MDHSPLNPTPSPAPCPKIFSKTLRGYPLFSLAVSHVQGAKDENLGFLGFLLKLYSIFLLLLLVFLHGLEQKKKIFF
jgi:hypothetical protein